MKDSFGLALATASPIDILVKYAVTAEKNNFKSVWVAEMASRYDLYQVLMTIAYRTSKLLLGPGATNPYTRHPFITAKNILTLNDVSGGRIHLALGAGDREYLKNLGIERERPAIAVKEAIKIFRIAFRKHNLSFAGRFFKVSNVHLTPYYPVKIPIFVASNGPIMLKIAGLYADGVMFNAMPLEGMKKALAYIHSGINNSENPNREFYVANMIPISVNASKKDAIKSVRPLLSFILKSLPNYLKEIIQERLISSGTTELPKSIKQIPDNIVEEFSIVGTIEECSDKIEQYFKAGVHQLAFILPRNVNRIKLIQLIGDKIISSFTDLEKK